MHKHAKIILITTILGFFKATTVLTVYLYDIFTQNDYRLCEINETVTCTGSVTAHIAQFLGMPVGAIAMFFYPIMASLAFWAMYSKRPQDQYFDIAILGSMGFVLAVVTNYNEYHYLGTISILSIIGVFIIGSTLVMAMQGYHHANRTISTTQRKRPSKSRK